VPAGFGAGGPDHFRVGPIRATNAVLAELGVLPKRAYDLAGLVPTLLDDPDRRIPIEVAGRLFDACVELTGCAHFGLLVGERFRLEHFGPLGDLLRNCATVGDAVRSLLLFLHFQDRAAVPVLLAEPSCMLLGYSIFRHGLPGAAQIQDCSIAIGHRLLGTLCGPSWKPSRVQLAHSRPASVAPYRRVFRSPVVFDADLSAVAFSPTWMRRPIEGADTALHDVIASELERTAPRGSMRFAEQVQRVLHRLVLDGTASSAAVSQLFGIDERTLRRRLRAEQASLQQLLNGVRFELARQLLLDTQQPIAEVAAALHYADPNVFSRAFRAWAGASPSQWRQEASTAAALRRRPVPRRRVRSVSEA